MVQSNGAITGTILKARFGDDVRKTSLHHANDVSFSDLAANVQRIFGLPSNNFTLKYKDQDGDLVTLAGDSDLLLALNTVGATLDVTVITDSRVHDIVQDLQSQVSQIKFEVGKLVGKLSSLDTLLADHSASADHLTAPPSIHDNIVLQKSYEEPPRSPAPSEREELPATIQPSIQEQFNHRSAHIEEDIPLENNYQQHQAPPISGGGAPPSLDSLNSSFSHPPVENFGSAPPPNAMIPSFPTSNAAVPPVQQQHEFSAPSPPVSAPQQFQAPPVTASHSSVSSTPIQQGPPQGQHYGAPPTPHQNHQQFGGPPPSGPPSEYGGYAPQPPQQQPQHQQQPPFGGPGGAPQGGPPQGPPQHFGGPPQQQPGFGPPQGFAPPQNQHQQQPPQSGYAPPPPVSAPGNFAPPPQTQAPGAFAPPQSGFGGPGGPPQGPPQGGPGGPGGYGPPPPGAFVPPPFGGPGGPPQGPPTGFPPAGAPGAPNPFARGPTAGYRQSPYHQ